MALKGKDSHVQLTLWRCCNDVIQEKIYSPLWTSLFTKSKIPIHSAEEELLPNDSNGVLGRNASKVGKQGQSSNNWSRHGRSRDSLAEAESKCADTTGS